MIAKARFLPSLFLSDEEEAAFSEGVRVCSPDSKLSLWREDSGKRTICLADKWHGARLVAQGSIINDGRAYEVQSLDGAEPCILVVSEALSRVAQPATVYMKVSDVVWCAVTVVRAALWDTGSPFDEDVLYVYWDLEE